MKYYDVYGNGLFKHIHIFEIETYCYVTLYYYIFVDA